MLTIEESKMRIRHLMGWIVQEETFQVIEERTCTWAAEVCTMHLGSTYCFYILVQSSTHFVIEKRWLSALDAWIHQF